MATRSGIEWTEYTWNPVTGCTKVSPGCKNCYADRMAKRLKAMDVPKYRNGFDVTVHEAAINEPLTWKTPRVVFVNSMSDLFHEAIADDVILRIFAVMAQTPQHRFQVLTKRSNRLVELNPKLTWSPNIWMGVSVENADYLYRIADLVQTGAAVKFLSLEPLLGPLRELPLAGIDWVIVGGESGPHCRPLQEAWVLPMRDQCHAAGVPFFFKQWGGVHKKRAGRLLEGRTWDEMPEQRPIAQTGS